MPSSLRIGPTRATAWRTMRGAGVPPIVGLSAGFCCALGFANDTTFGRSTAMATVGSGRYTYELVPDFFKLPAGQTFGLVSRVAADDQDRIYVFQRKDPPVVVFNRDGIYLGAWGSDLVADPHGLKI